MPPVAPLISNPELPKVSFEEVEIIQEVTDWGSHFGSGVKQLLDAVVVWLRSPATFPR